MADNSILTVTQRTFLRLSREERQEEYTKQQRSYHRGEISERVRTAIVDDMPLILACLDAEEAFEQSDRTELADGIRCTVAFVYRLAEGAGLDAERVIDEGVTQGQIGREDQLLEQFREDPSVLRVGEIEFLLNQDLIDLSERNEALGLPIPEHLESDDVEVTTTVSDEELKEYGTGVQERPDNADE